MTAIGARKRKPKSQPPPIGLQYRLLGVKPPRPALRPYTTTDRNYYDLLDTVALASELRITPPEAEEEMRRLPNAECHEGVYRVKWGHVMRQLFPWQHEHERWSTDAQVRQTPFPAPAAADTDAPARDRIKPYRPTEVNLQYLRDHHGLKSATTGGRHAFVRHEV